MSSFLSWIVGGDTKEKEWHGKKTFSGVDSDNNQIGSTYEGNWLGEKNMGTECGDEMIIWRGTRAIGMKTNAMAKENTTGQTIAGTGANGNSANATEKVNITVLTGRPTKVNTKKTLSTAKGHFTTRTVRGTRVAGRTI